MSPRSTTPLPDLTGRRAVVTGGTSGLGLETARRLAAAGAEVVLTARTDEKGRTAVDDIRSTTPGARVEHSILELADLESVAEFSARTSADNAPLDLLINNAGVMAVPHRHTTVDGFEVQFGTNHLGHFALTARLLPALLIARAPRVITLSSLAHRGGRFDFDDLHSERTYSPWGAYATSKLANLVFARELARRSRCAGWGILSTAAHPGLSSTNLQRAGKEYGQAPSGGHAPKSGSTSPSVRNRILMTARVLQDAAAGARPTLRAATGSDVKPGDYFGPGNAFELTGAPRRARSSRLSRNEDVAKRLWSESERLVGLQFS
ncbi:SDR family oxidoreductase [Planctomonas psychrotolerans]|uniref:SDR family oxidoreductase n=1 Tax=Planctomonas psychrotolerans TaxID=2528712 RepID=UPI001239B1D1|nr:SDR family oxidoreductase [Planctomonas psychrotolerans]